MDTEKNIRVCHICGMEMSTISTLNRHLKNKHNIVKNSEYSTECLEPNCTYRCVKVIELRSHLEYEHGKNQEFEEITFKNMQDFNKWKESEEIRSKSSWVKHRGTRQNITYFHCSRSGKQRIVDPKDRQRMLKSQGSSKINATCTSVITLRKIADDDLRITYYKTHYGHDFNLSHISLPEISKRNIATQIIQGVPATEILNKIRQSVDTNFGREHLTTRKDIHNITHSNMCKHIHKVGIEVEMPKTQEHIGTQVDQVEHEEKSMHLNNLKSKNTRIFERIQENVNILSLQPSTIENCSTDILQKIDNQLISLVNIANCSRNTIQCNAFKNPGPANKRIDVQARFCSTNKNKKTVGRISKPSTTEARKIKNILESL